MLTYSKIIFFVYMFYSQMPRFKQYIFFIFLLSILRFLYFLYCSIYQFLYFSIFLFLLNHYFCIFPSMFIVYVTIVPRTNVVVLMEYKNCQLNYCKVNSFFFIVCLILEGYRFLMCFVRSRLNIDV